MSRHLFVLLVALAGAMVSPPSHAKRTTETVVVQDAFIDLRTGPGRGFPIAYSVERSATIALLRQRTDWIKVRTDGGREGWVHRSQLERTLTQDGAEVRVAGPTPEARTEHRWEASLLTGDFGGANLLGVRAAYALAPGLVVRADVSQLLGDYSDGWLGAIGIAHVFAPHWRVSPVVGVLETLVRESGMSDRVHFLGALGHDLLPRVLSAADAVVLPSASEGLANAWVEALACGCPLVITDAGGARELVTSPAAGRIVPREAEAVAEAVRELLTAPPAREAVAACAARFSWEANAAALSDYYEQLLEA